MLGLDGAGCAWGSQAGMRGVCLSKMSGPRALLQGSCGTCWESAREEPPALAPSQAMHVPGSRGVSAVGLSAFLAQPFAFITKVLVARHGSGS